MKSKGVYLYVLSVIRVNPDETAGKQARPMRFFATHTDTTKRTGGPANAARI